MRCTLLLLLVALSPAAAWRSAVVPAVTSLDASLYAGRWYQISADRIVTLTFERNAACVTADYVVDGTVIKLVNSETVYGKLTNITGQAYAADDTKPAELTVEFDGIPAKGSYWVIKLGPVVDGAYQYSVVSDKASQTLFVLARDVDGFATSYAAEVDDFLKASGFVGFYAPRLTSQSNCTYAPVTKVVKAASVCPRSPALLHAGCEETIEFEEPCSDVIEEILARIQGQYDTWHDPHNNGTYTLVTQTDAALDLTRQTNNGKYTDHVAFTFFDDDEESDAGCVARACSTSQVTSYIDYGTNHCNLFALYCGTQDNCAVVSHDLTYTETIHKCSDAQTACVATTV